MNSEKDYENWYRKWIVDAIPDANGSWTIRFTDENVKHDVNGDTDEQPIATVYELAYAERIVKEHNEFLDKLPKPKKEKIS